jgi:hypothetical protein
VHGRSAHRGNVSVRVRVAHCRVGQSAVDREARFSARNSAWQIVCRRAILVACRCSRAAAFSSPRATPICAR